MADLVEKHDPFAPPVQCVLSGSDFQLNTRLRRKGRVVAAAAVAALLLLALAACRGQEAPPAAEHPVATVNGERIELEGV